MNILSKMFIFLLIFFTHIYLLFPLPASFEEKKEKIILGFSTGEYPAEFDYGKYINYLVSCRYVTDSSGNITTQYPYDNAIIKNTKNGSIKHLAMVTNNFSYIVSKGLLEKSENRKKCVKNILISVLHDNYDGVNIDFEYIPSSCRESFTLFISELSTVFRKYNLLLNVDVPAKYTDNFNDSWNGAFDYAELAKYCDHIILMTYDEHYIKGDPGAIASYEWVENVAKYASSIVPTEKLLIGLAAYGYDWNPIKNAAYGLYKIESFKNTEGYNYTWDEASKTPYITYTDNEYNIHNLWYEDCQSIKYKLEIVNKYKLGGVSIWRLGFEHEQYLSTIKEYFEPTVDKSYLVRSLPPKGPKLVEKELLSSVPPYLYGKEKKTNSVPVWFDNFALISQKPSLTNGFNFDRMGLKNSYASIRLIANLNDEYEHKLNAVAYLYQENNPVIEKNTKYYANNTNVKNKNFIGGI